MRPHYSFQDVSEPALTLTDSSEDHERSKVELLWDSREEGASNSRSKSLRRSQGDDGLSCQRIMWCPLPWIKTNKQTNRTHCQPVYMFCFHFLSGFVFLLSYSPMKRCVNKRGRGRGCTRPAPWRDTRLEKFPRLQSEWDDAHFSPQNTLSFHRLHTPSSAFSSLWGLIMHIFPPYLRHRHMGAPDSSQIAAPKEGDPKVSQVSQVNLSRVCPGGGGGGWGESEEEKLRESWRVRRREAPLST